jgi:Ca2+-binding RTX toxin-like protein
MDDYAGDQSTTARLNMAEPVYGTIETIGDEDWFRIEFEASATYFFELVGRAVAPYTLQYADFDIFDENSVLVRGSTGSGVDAGSDTFATYTAVAGGSYFVSVQGTEFRDALQEDPVGTYRLTAVELVPEVKHQRLSLEVDDLPDLLDGDGRAPSTPIAVNQTLYAESNSGQDQDWFTVTAEAGKVYFAQMNTGIYQTYRSNQNSDIELWDADANSLKMSNWLDGAGFQQGLTFSSDTDTTFYVAPEHRHYNGASQGIYSVTLTELPSLEFTSGSDWLTLPVDLWPGVLDIKGGGGGDMMSFSGHDTGVEVNLATGLARSTGAEAFSLIMDDIEGVTGTSFGDRLHGSDGNDKMRGLGGRDVIYGSAGARDTIDGGGSTDLLDYVGSDSGVSVSLLRGRGWGGDAQGDRIAAIEGVAGSNHDDFIWGDHGNNRLEGRHGDDTLVGNGGDDYILAGHGHDMVVYSGNLADYTITHDGLRTEVIHNNDGWDGHDIIGHAEVLRFADGDLLL